MATANNTSQTPRNQRLVLIISLLLVLGFGILGLINPQLMSAAALGTVNFTLNSIGWFYLLLCSGFLILSGWLAFGPYGQVRLGPDGSKPEFSTPSWLAMLFAGGMGAGLVFWGVAEPVSHFAQPPGNVEALTPASARLAMTLTNLHWGLHAWSIYAVCSLVLAYFIFRRDMPGLISTPIRATLGASRFVRSLGFTSDILATFSVVFGLAGSLVMGVLQVRAGMAVVFGLEPTTILSLIILAAIAVAFMLSASTGLSKGIQILSNVNMALVIVLLLIVVLLGPTAYIMEAFINAIGDYIASLPAYSFRLLSYENQRNWTNAWTLTYLIWWVAWGPFVGIFIARISKGRTIREFCVGVIMIPTVFSIFWFAALGGTGIWIELKGGGGLASLVSEDVATALFVFLGYMPFSSLLGVLSLILIFIFLVTSADSGTFVISMMTSEGKLNPSTPLKLAWGLAITLLTLTILLSEKVEIAKAMAIFGAIPFVMILVLQVVGFLRALKEEPVRKDKQ